MFNDTTSKIKCVAEDSDKPTYRSYSEKMREKKAELAALTGDAAINAAKETGLRMLNCRAFSRGELMDRLLTKGYSAAAVNEVLSRFEQAGFLDDEAYARMLLHARHEERGLVGRALYRELANKKIPSELIDQVVSEIDSEREKQVALTLARRKALATRGLEYATRVRRIGGHLARKGYESETIRSVINQVLEEEADDN